jgi:hypothetical protein
MTTRSMLDVVIEADTIRIGERFAVTFQRTLRIPDDGGAYPLPPGLGRLPVFKVEDYYERVPSLWRESGGAFIPMYQREALWLGFHAAVWKPNAVKIAVGGVNAISGGADDERLHSDPQDYVVCPDQPWLDGIHTGKATVRQFVAMPLGLGYTVEASIAGSETLGGIQMTVFEPKPGRFPDKRPVEGETGPVRMGIAKSRGMEMGLGAGGVMKQKIYPDPHGIDVWDQDNRGRVFIHIVNSMQFLEITGAEPPPTPIDGATYTKHGFPWFDLYDEEMGDVAPSDRLAGVKTISARDAERGEPADTDSFQVSEAQVRKLRKDDAKGEGRQPPAPDSPGHPRGRQ